MDDLDYPDILDLCIPRETPPREFLDFRSTSYVDLAR